MHAYDATLLFLLMFNYSIFFSFLVLMLNNELMRAFNELKLHFDALARFSSVRENTVI
jgi:hypothetical protein